MKILNRLPRFLRLFLIRMSIRIAPPPEGLQIAIAISQEELEKAYELLHDCYVGTKLMAPDPSGLRCNFYSFLPNTTTVVAKINDQVVGTVSLIKDSPAGLPSDKDFKKENDELRYMGRRLVEVSSLAIDKKYRDHTHAVSLYLMKYLQHYTTHHMGCTTVTCVIHPRARDFYAAFWGFRANQRIIKYKFVNDALGVQMFGDITDDDLRPLSKLFRKSENNNPIHFLFKHDSFMLFPKRNIDHHLDPIFTPALLKYFLSERTEAYKKLSRAELLTIYSAYSLFFNDLEKFHFFKNFSSSSFDARLFRFPAKILARMTDLNNQFAVGYLMDISQSGAFFASDSQLQMGEKYVIEFELGFKRFSFLCMPRWQNRRLRNHQLLGYGIEFTQTQLEIAQLLKKTHLANSLKFKIAK